MARGPGRGLLAARGPGRGVLAEILGSLALVMGAAAGVLALVLALHHESGQRELLAALLAAEARAESPGRGALPDTRWWRVDAAGEVHTRAAAGEPIDPASRALGEEARRADAALLRMGPPWGDVRFALPLTGDGRVAVARLPAASVPGGGVGPRLVTLAILVLDVAVFLAFGTSLLRARVVLPLRRLAEAALALAERGPGVRVPEEGARETMEVAAAFNGMSATLEVRTGELEKAVAELRAANRILRDTQASLVRSERLAAVGRLAAGVAHEVGNPMGALLAFLDLVGRDPGLASSSRAHLARAAEQGERVRRILRQMLDFSRPTRHARSPVDLASLAAETAALLRAQERYRGVEICVEVEPAAPPALADAAAVSQILLNLVQNAADAASASPTPRVAIVVCPAVLHARAGDRGAARERRRFDAVECRVRDNGPGVPEPDRTRVFDFFFTTKAPGEGTGLGLANALRLAEEMGGGLELEDAGPGACFVLRLPAAGCEDGCEVRNALRSPGAGAGAPPRDEPQA